MAKTKRPKFSAHTAAQPIYKAIDEVIRDLSHQEAVSVLEEVSAHAKAEALVIEEEMME